MLVGQRTHAQLHAVLAFHAVLKHVELQRTDHADHDVLEAGVAEEVARECAANFVNLEECGEPTVSVVPLGDESGAGNGSLPVLFLQETERH